jgi:glycosyltransferase involved in cell wall biosynthesis
MTKQTQNIETRPHVSVCICTFRRTELLQRLLDGLRDQATDGRFTYSVVVCDNDSERSAEATVGVYEASVPFAVRYCVETRQNIALARNRTLEVATGNFVAFIDDDEIPPRQWLLTLVDACVRYAADGALGPVRPHFDVEPPKWVVQGGFYNRATYRTGTFINWRQGRTGNTLLRRSILSALPVPFRPEFLSGEDQDFFRRAIAAGQRFVWCDEAAVVEVVPPVRWNRSFMIKRALLQGAAAVADRSPRRVVTSVIAAPLYLAALPLTLGLGQARFMRCMVKLCAHVGTLCAAARITLVSQPYVTE